MSSYSVCLSCLASFTYYNAVEVHPRWNLNQYLFIAKHDPAIFLILFSH